jgi:hypothetical protein
MQPLQFLAAQAVTMSMCDEHVGMKVKMLMPHTPESKRLVEWVEQGVQINCLAARCPSSTRSGSVS